MEQKVALITGAGRGLGLYLAQKLTTSGVAVALHYRNSQAGAEAAAEELRAGGHHAMALGGVLEEESGAAAVVQGVLANWGRLDILIHNGGHYEHVPFLELSSAAWREGIASTLDAGYFTAKAGLPHLRSQGGRIIMIGDSNCERASARDMALSYHIGKTGVLMLTRSLAVSEAPYGITCNCVSPGYMETSLGLPAVSTMPAGRFGQYEDLWQAMKWLLSPESSYVNGTHLVVSGGWNLK